MSLSPSAHVDTFTRDNLPPVDQWPDLVFDLPELQYPDRLNCAEELLGGSIARFGPNRPCLRDASGTVWSYGEVRDRVDQIAQVLADDLGILPGNRVLAARPEQSGAGGLLVRCAQGRRSRRHHDAAAAGR